MDNVDSSDDTESGSTKRKGKKTGHHQSIFTADLKNQLQWYIRNPLFQNIKIVDETHLYSNGNIIQDILEYLKIDKSSRNLNAYINECRQIIKRVMSSRRGYVKKRIGKKFKGE